MWSDRRLPVTLALGSSMLIARTKLGVRSSRAKKSVISLRSAALRFAAMAWPTYRKLPRAKLLLGSSPLRQSERDLLHLLVDHADLDAVGCGGAVAAAVIHRLAVRLPAVRAIADRGERVPPAAAL